MPDMVFNQDPGVVISGLGHTRPDDEGMHIVDNTEFIMQLDLPTQALLFKHPGIFIPSEHRDQVTTVAQSWENERPGIKTRVISSLNTEEVAILAAHRALANSRLKASDLGAIIVSSNTKDCIYPKLSSSILHALPGFSSNTSCSDLSGSCADGALMLMHGAALLRADVCKHVLCVAAERADVMGGRNNFKAANLWGSGAAAVILSLQQQPGLIAIETHDDPENRDKIHQDLTAPPYQPTWDRRWGATSGRSNLRVGPFEQDGPEVVKWVGKYVVPRAVTFILRHADPLQGIKKVVCHQASTSLLDTAEQKMIRQIPSLEGKFYRHFSTRGNCSSASTAIGLSELVEAGELQKGDMFVLIAFGAGLQAVFVAGVL